MNVANTIEEYRNIYPDVPKNNDMAINWIISRIRYNTPSSDKKKLSRHFKRESNGVIYEDTLDTYYVQLINDTLKLIHLGEKAYVFNFEQIKDIIRFEHSAKFNYIADSNSFEVTL